MESKQALLNRVVDIGVELFAIASACAYADSLMREEKEKGNALELADLFCTAARARIERSFSELCSNHDPLTLSVAKKVLANEFEWMENEIIK